MLMNVIMPVEPFNTLSREGLVGDIIKEILDSIKPEAAYFTEQGGARGAILVVDVKNPSDVPRLAEPFFLKFDADVEFRIVMLPEDLAKADLGKLGKKWG